MTARLLAYSVADVLQASEKIEGENSYELFTHSINVITTDPRFRTPKVVLRACGEPDFEWIKKNLKIPWLENSPKRVSK